MSVLSFEVVGHPEPAGSKTNMPRRKFPVTLHSMRDFMAAFPLVDANPKAKAWKKTVAEAASAAMREHGLSPFDGPVWLWLTFRVRRPKGHYLPGGELSAEGKRHRFPTRKPDVLKLSRAAEDGMSGIVYVDDAMIVREVIVKEFTAGPEGVTVTAMAL